MEDIDGKITRKDGKESNTTKAIKAFQTNNKLPVNGLIDSSAKAALSSAVVAKGANKPAEVKESKPVAKPPVASKPASKPVARDTKTRDTTQEIVIPYLPGQAPASASKKQPEYSFMKWPEQADLVKPVGVVNGEATGSEAEIREIQEDLKVLGFYDGNIDGMLTLKSKKESGTTKAIKAFQSSSKLKATGIVDANTRAALAAAVKANKAIREAEKLARKDVKTIGPLMTRAMHKAQAAGSTNCNDVAIDMIKGYLIAKGINPDDYSFGPGLSTNAYPLVLEDHSDRKKAIGEDNDNKVKVRSYESNLLIKQSEWQKAIDYIDKHLTNKIPVLVGVDHTYSRTLAGGKSGKNSSFTEKTYNEGTTDHWIVVIGKGEIGGKKYYQYFDPGRKSDPNKIEDDGAGANNRLIQSDKPGEEHIWRDPDGAMKGTYGYTLTCVAKFNKDRTRKK
jgi:peptidoglycan hydrolase-like protein with peptidoglycan-binding domain